MSGCGDGCGAKAAEGATGGYRRALGLVVALNFAMFLIGAVIAIVGKSVSVQSDVLDFLGDSVATGMGLLLALSLIHI